MNRLLIALIAALGAVSASYAQLRGDGWWLQCVDPENTTWISDDFGFVRVENALIGATVGISGNVTWGGQNGPCYAPTARTLDAAGRFSFYVGSTGSVQDDVAANGFSDDFMALTVGASDNPVGDYTFTRIMKGTNDPADSVLFGDGGIAGSFVGASFRYAVVIWADADVQATLETRVVGDAVRLKWDLVNLQAEAQPLGMLFAITPGMFLTSGSDVGGATQANSLLFTATGNPKFFPPFYIGFNTTATGRPIQTERKWLSSDPDFPDSIYFQFGQTNPYGVRLENTPTQATRDASAADLVIVGGHGAPFISPGLVFDNTIRLNVYGDLIGNQRSADVSIEMMSAVQRFPVQSVAPGGVRTMVQYIRSTWSEGVYLDPYSVVLDAPRLINSDANGTNGLSPNPITVRAYLDNQYARIDQEIAMQNVEFSITLPDELQLAPGETVKKTIANLGPNAIGNVQWQLVADGTVSGEFPVDVTVRPTPGPARTVRTFIRIAATPRLNVVQGPNMVAIPYSFADQQLDTILSQATPPLQNGVNYVAYRWDPSQVTYVPTLTIQRGEGIWLVPSTAPNPSSVPLNQAQIPGDTATGGTLISLGRGWNLIGNPYNYPIPLGTLVGVAEDNPATSLTWAQLVSQNIVSSGLAYFEPDGQGSGQYVFTRGAFDVLEPHRAYWIYVNSFNPVRISFPPVFTPGLAPSNRSEDEVWRNNDRQWRLQLSARTATAIDSQNFVGVAADPLKADTLSLPKPPMAPGQSLELSIGNESGNGPTRMAQSIADRLSPRTWKVYVRSEEAGEVTVTWPNLASVPRNVRLRLTDVATGEVRDLRAVSGYTFRMNEAGTREFLVSMDPSGASRAVIGNVLVTRPSRDPNAPVTISYALSADALVSIRVLSGSGAEVYSVSRGRSESAGENTATWQLRDNADRAVAPGVYRIEIVAETPSGERVRRLVPVNVTR